MLTNGMSSQGDTPDDERMLQALCNAVISAAVDEEEDEEAVTLLTELLAEEGVDPNAGDEASLEKVMARAPRTIRASLSRLSTRNRIPRVCCLTVLWFHPPGSGEPALCSTRTLRLLVALTCLSAQG